MILTDRIAAILSGKNIPAKTKNELAVKKAIDKADYVIHADATMDGSTLTITNIDRTPAEVEDVVVREKKTAALQLTLEFEAGVYIPAYVPLGQIFGGAYEFVGTVSTDEHGTNIVAIELQENEENPGQWVSNGKIVIIPE